MDRTKALLNAGWPILSDNRSWKPIPVLFWVVALDKFYCILTCKSVLVCALVSLSLRTKNWTVISDTIVNSLWRYWRLAEVKRAGYMLLLDYINCACTCMWHVSLAAFCVSSSWLGEWLLSVFVALPGHDISWSWPLLVITFPGRGASWSWISWSWSFLVMNFLVMVLPGNGVSWSWPFLVITFPGHGASSS